ncbi:MAG: lysine--tRNA ligase, partial [Thaumarchaeota archaeon]|nr:lysine--tRNA ligase [Nitrososphaerota archaeon]
KLKGLYLYSHLLKPPEKPSTHIPYSLIVELAIAAPEDKRLEFVVSRLRRYGYQIDRRAEEKIRLAINYAKDFGAVEREKVELSESERKAISELIERIREAADADEIQSSIFEVARRNGLSPKNFFKKLYQIFLGRDRGPRLGPYIWDLGKDRALEILQKSLSSQ